VNNTLSDTNEWPLVSVVMCTCNGEDFVSKQLDSLINQTYPNLEIIISDDASTNNTLAILRAYATKDARIKLYVNEQNLGFTKNFSNACLLASANHIAFCDQDDIWHLEKIERMMKAWVEGASLMYANSVRFTDESKIPVLKENKHYRRFEGEDLRKIAVFNTISGHAMIVKRELLKHILPFKEGIMYDWWAAAVAACIGGVGYLNEILVFQRVHGGNVSVGKGFSHLEKNYKKDFMQMVSNHLSAFSNIEELSIEQKHFFEKFYRIWNEAMHKKFSLSLFLFLLKHRTVVFWYKKRKFALFSHIKHSYKLSRN
jgi:glycosyltransferase involved in cell wall biosynthesis